MSKQIIKPQAAPQLLKTGQKQVVQISKGQHLRVQDVIDGAARDASNVVAIKQGNHLNLKFADGTELQIENFYAECGGNACSVTVAGKDAAGYTLSGDTAAGAAVSDGGQLVYAYGEQGSLMAMASSDPGLATALGSLGEGTVAYIPAAAGASPWLGALGLAGVGGGGGGGGAAAGAPGGVVNNVVKGFFVAGPALSGNDLEAKAYGVDKKGQTFQLPLENSDLKGPFEGVRIDSTDGSFELKLGQYEGPVLVIVSDAGDGTADYRDEATGLEIDLNVALRALTVVSGGTVTVNVNPATELAVRTALSNQNEDDPADLQLPDASAIFAANNRVAELLSLTTDLVQGPPPVPVINADGSKNSKANEYGYLLAYLSGLDEINKEDGKDPTDLTLSQLAALLTDNADRGGSFKQAQNMLIDGSRQVDVLNQLTTDTSLTIADLFLIGARIDALRTELAGGLTVGKVTTLASLQKQVGVPANPNAKEGGADYEATGLYALIDNLEQKIQGEGVAAEDFTTLAALKALIGTENTAAEGEESNATGLYALIGSSAGNLAKEIGAANTAAEGEESNATGLYLLIETSIAKAIDNLEQKIQGPGVALEDFTTLAALKALIDELKASAGGDVSKLQLAVGEPAKPAVGVEGEEGFVPATAATGLYLLIEKIKSRLDGLDTTAPEIVDISLSATGADIYDHLNAGDVVTATVKFSEAVLVAGAPTLQLKVGDSTVVATYESGAGTDSLVFTYTILANQTDANGISVPADALQLGNATIKDSAGNAANVKWDELVDDLEFIVDNGPLVLSASAGTLFGSQLTADNVLVGVIFVEGSNAEVPVFLSELDANGNFHVPEGSAFINVDDYLNALSTNDEVYWLEHLVAAGQSVHVSLDGKLAWAVSAGFQAVLTEETLRAWLVKSNQANDVDAIIATQTVPAEQVGQFDGFYAGETLAQSFLAQTVGHSPADVLLTVTSPLTLAQAVALKEAGFDLTHNVVYSLRDYDTAIQAAMLVPATAAAVRGATQVTALGDELANAMRYTSFNSLVNLRIEPGAGNDTIDTGRGDEQIVGGRGMDTINLTYLDTSEDTVIYQTVYDGKTLPVTTVAFASDANYYREGAVLTVAVKTTVYSMVNGKEKAVTQTHTDTYTVQAGDTPASALEALAAQIRNDSGVQDVIVHNNVLEIFGTVNALSKGGVNYEKPTKLSVTAPDAIVYDGVKTQWTVAFSADADDYPSSTSAGGTVGYFDRYVHVKIGETTVDAQIVYDNKGTAKPAETLTALKSAIEAAMGAGEDGILDTDDDNTQAPLANVLGSVSIVDGQLVLTGKTAPVSDGVPSFIVGSASIDVAGTQQQTEISFSSKNADYYEGGTLRVEIEGRLYEVPMVPDDAVASVAALRKEILKDPTVELVTQVTDGFRPIIMSSQVWLRGGERNNYDGVDAYMSEGALQVYRDYGAFSSAVSVLITDSDLVTASVTPLTSNDTTVTFANWEDFAKAWQVAFRRILVTDTINVTVAQDGTVTSITVVDTTLDYSPRSANFSFRIPVEVPKLVITSSVEGEMGQDWIANAQQDYAGSAQHATIDLETGGEYGLYDAYADGTSTSRGADVHYVGGKAYLTILSAGEDGKLGNGDDVATTVSAAMGDDATKTAANLAAAINTAAGQGGALFGIVGAASANAGHITLSAAAAGKEMFKVGDMRLDYQGVKQIATVSLDVASRYDYASDGTEIRAGGEPSVYYKNGKAYLTIKPTDGAPVLIVADMVVDQPAVLTYTGFKNFGSIGYFSVGIYVTVDGIPTGVSFDRSYSGRQTSTVDQILTDIQQKLANANVGATAKFEGNDLVITTASAGPAVSVSMDAFFITPEGSTIDEVGGYSSPYEPFNAVGVAGGATATAEALAKAINDAAALDVGVEGSLNGVVGHASANGATITIESAAGVREAFEVSDATLDYQGLHQIATADYSTSSGDYYDGGKMHIGVTPKDGSQINISANMVSGDAQASLQALKAAIEHEMVYTPAVPGGEPAIVRITGNYAEDDLLYDFGSGDYQSWVYVDIWMDGSQDPIYHLPQSGSFQEPPPVATLGQLLALIDAVGGLDAYLDDGDIVIATEATGASKTLVVNFLAWGGINVYGEDLSGQGSGGAATSEHYGTLMGIVDGVSLDANGVITLTSATKAKEVFTITNAEIDYVDPGEAGSYQTAVASFEGEDSYYYSNASYDGGKGTLSQIGLTLHNREFTQSMLAASGEGQGYKSAAQNTVAALLEKIMAAANEADEDAGGLSDYANWLRANVNVRLSPDGLSIEFEAKTKSSSDTLGLADTFMTVEPVTQVSTLNFSGIDFETRVQADGDKPQVEVSIAGTTVSADVAAATNDTVRNLVEKIVLARDGAGTAATITSTVSGDELALTGSLTGTEILGYGKVLVNLTIDGQPVNFTFDPLHSANAGRVTVADLVQAINQQSPSGVVVSLVNGKLTANDGDTLAITGSLSFTTLDFTGPDNWLSSVHAALGTVGWNGADGVTLTAAVPGVDPLQIGVQYQTEDVSAEGGQPQIIDFTFDNARFDNATAIPAGTVIEVKIDGITAHYTIPEGLSGNTRSEAIAAGLKSAIEAAAGQGSTIGTVVQGGWNFETFVQLDGSPVNGYNVLRITANANGANLLGSADEASITVTVTKPGNVLVPLAITASEVQAGDIVFAWSSGTGVAGTLTEGRNEGVLTDTADALPVFKIGNTVIDNDSGLPVVHVSDTSGSEYIAPQTKQASQWVINPGYGEDDSPGYFGDAAQMGGVDGEGVFNSLGIQQTYTGPAGGHVHTSGSAQDGSNGEGDASFYGDAALIGVVNGEDVFNHEGVKQTYTNPADGYSAIAGSPQLDGEDAGTGHSSLYGSNPGTIDGDGVRTRYLNGGTTNGEDADASGNFLYTSQGGDDLSALIDYTQVQAGADASTNALGERAFTERAGFAPYTWDLAGISTVTPGNIGPDLINNFQVDHDRIALEGSLRQSTQVGGIDGVAATGTGEGTPFDLDLYEYGLVDATRSTLDAADLGDAEKVAELLNSVFRFISDGEDSVLNTSIFAVTANDDSNATALWAHRQSSAHDATVQAIELYQLAMVNTMGGVLGEEFTLQNFQGVMLPN